MTRRNAHNAGLVVVFRGGRLWKPATVVLAAPRDHPSMREGGGGRLALEAGFCDKDTAARTVVRARQCKARQAQAHAHAHAHTHARGVIFLVCWESTGMTMALECVRAQGSGGDMDVAVGGGGKRERGQGEIILTALWWGEKESTSLQSEIFWGWESRERCAQ